MILALWKNHDCWRQDWHRTQTAAHKRVTILSWEEENISMQWGFVKIGFAYIVTFNAPNAFILRLKWKHQFHHTERASSYYYNTVVKTIHTILSCGSSDKKQKYVINAWKTVGKQVAKIKLVTSAVYMQICLNFFSYVIITALLQQLVKSYSKNMNKKSEKKIK